MMCCCSPAPSSSYLGLITLSLIRCSELGDEHASRSKVRGLTDNITRTVTRSVFWNSLNKLRCPLVLLYLGMSTVMSLVSGICDGYFFDVNFPEKYSAVSFSVKADDRINLTLHMPGEHVGLSISCSYDITSFYILTWRVTGDLYFLFTQI